MRQKNKHWLSNSAVILVMILIMVSCEFFQAPHTSSPDKSQNPFQSPSPNITRTPYQLPIPFEVEFAWFYKPPASGRLDLLAQNFDVFILTHKDEKERDQLRTMGVTNPILQYLLLAEIREPENCNILPYGNQVAYHAGDFCQISAEHPDWFLLDQFGNRIGTQNGIYHMDPGNTGYREFWLSRAVEMQSQFDWDGVFIDNAEGGISKFLKKGSLPRKYPDNSSYQLAVEGFLSYLRKNYFEPYNRPMYANIVSTDNDTTWQRYFQYLDGAMIEAFAVDWSDGYRSKKSWEEQMTLIEQALGQGKGLILVSQGDEQDKERQLFAYASYLLVANENTSFRYTNVDSYNQIWFYDNYFISLGAPLNSRYRHKLVWRRDFTNGSVLVNPSNHSAKIEINP